jgi:hypothetical protein
VEETFCDVSADVSPDVSADVSSGPCSHLPDEIIMEIFSYLPPNQVWYLVPYGTYVLFSTNAVFWIRILDANQLADFTTFLLILFLEIGSHVP